MKKDKVQILKCLVGSRAHGLATAKSDTDYRAVYVNATTEILRIGHKYIGNHWVEGEKEDQTAYEIGHFLKLASRCNPTALEVLVAPRIGYNNDKGMITSDTLGDELVDLFPYIWNPNDAFNAFKGYSSNQRKKMIDKKDNRGPKFACAYLRTVWNLYTLLETGTFSLEIIDPYKKQYLLNIRKGNFSAGEVLDIAEKVLAECEILRDKSKQVSDLDKVHEFLMKVRKEYWEIN